MRQKKKGFHSHHKKTPKTDAQKHTRNQIRSQTKHKQKHTIAAKNTHNRQKNDAFLKKTAYEVPAAACLFCCLSLKSIDIFTKSSYTRRRRRTILEDLFGYMHFFARLLAGQVAQRIYVAVERDPRGRLVHERGPFEKQDQAERVAATMEEFEKTLERSHVFRAEACDPVKYTKRARKMLERWANGRALEEIAAVEEELLEEDDEGEVA